jgi:hypothetical protein
VSQGIPNLVDSDEYHCTLIYSKTECLDVANEDFALPCKALITGYKLLGEEKKVLVLEPYCPTATRLHELFVNKHGATQDYDEYIAHITIAKDYEGDVPAELPEFEVEFSGMTVDELN